MLDTEVVTFSPCIQMEGITLNVDNRSKYKECPNISVSPTQHCLHTSVMG